MVESRLRVAVIGLAGFGFVGLLFELLLQQHYSRGIQYVPFFLIGAGLVSIGLILVWPARWSVLLVGITGVVIAAGALLGIYFHWESIIALEREFAPEASFRELIGYALITGAPAPPLAPGGLAVGGALLIAATYKHPMLGDN